MATASEAVAATPTDDVALSADKLADRKIGDIGAYGYDLADEFMTDGKALPDGGSSPGIPVVDVEIGAADSGVEDANFDIVDTHFGFGDVLEPETAFVAAFY
jgi:hypothetical protein